MKIDKNIKLHTSQRYVIDQTLIGDRMRSIRNKYKVSQKMVADALGVSERQYMMYENGNTMPSIDVLVAFVNISEFAPYATVDYLLGLTDIPNIYVDCTLKNTGFSVEAIEKINAIDIRDGDRSMKPCTSLLNKIIMSKYFESMYSCIGNITADEIALFGSLGLKRKLSESFADNKEKYIKQVNNHNDIINNKKYHLYLAIESFKNIINELFPDA